MRRNQRSKKQYRCRSNSIFCLPIAFIKLSSKQNQYWHRNFWWLICWRWSLVISESGWRFSNITSIRICLWVASSKIMVRRRRNAKNPYCDHLQSNCIGTDREEIKFRFFLNVVNLSYNDYKFLVQGKMLAKWNYT